MDSKYHGKIIQFEDSQKFENLLPKRDDFVDKDRFNTLSKGIRNNKPMVFLPNDILEQHFKDGGRLMYKLILFGILRDGSKAAVVLNGIYPFFDIKIPNDIKSSSFQKILLN